MRELWAEIIARNDVDHDDLISVIIAVTDDLHCMFAGTALREECGLSDVPLLGTVDATVVDGIQRTIRLMVHLNTSLSRSEITHVYLRDAAALRKDLSDQ